jgi:hypothetical protein
MNSASWPGEQGGVDDVLGEHHLAEALRRDEHDVARSEISTV